MALLDDFDGYPMSNKDLQEAINNAYAILKQTTSLSEDFIQHIKDLLAEQLIRAKERLPHEI